MQFSGLLLGSILLCFFVLVSGDKKTEIAWGYTVYKIYPAKCKMHSDNVLTTFNSGPEVSFQQNVGNYEEQEWVLKREKNSTKDQLIARLINLRNRDNIVSNNAFEMTLTKDSSAYILKCQTCNMCLTDKDGTGVVEAECTPDNPSQEFVFIEQIDPLDPVSATTVSPTTTATTTTTTTKTIKTTKKLWPF